MNLGLRCTIINPIDIELVSELWHLHMCILQPSEAPAKRVYHYLNFLRFNFFAKDKFSSF